MCSIMGLIGPELSELSGLELEIMLHLTVNYQISTNINQSAPNLVKMSLSV